MLSLLTRIRHLSLDIKAKPSKKGEFISEKDYAFNNL